MIVDEGADVVNVYCHVSFQRAALAMTFTVDSAKHHFSNDEIITPVFGRLPGHVW